jgi:hypothetical protein
MLFSASVDTDELLGTIGMCGILRILISVVMETR